jgi:DNA-binding NarL/FixJ family response regulator
VTTWTSIAIVDRQLTFADTLATQLLNQDHVQRTWAHTTIDALLAALHSSPVDVALLDWSLCSGHPFQSLRERHPDLKFMATGHDQRPADIVAALEAGALGWVPKHIALEELLTGIRTVSAGDRWLPASLLTGVLEALAKPRDEGRARRLLQPLTHREREVLQCMVDGLTRDQIAVQLDMSPNTVRTHVQRVLRKLGVHSSLRAVAVAREAGLVAELDSFPRQRNGTDRTTRGR